MTDPTDREQTIRGLREALRYLEQHPDVPVSRYVFIHHRVDAALASDGRVSGAARRAEVDRVAEILGEEPSDRDGEYVVKKRFSGGVIYRAQSSDPGPRPGLCAICNFNPVHRADAGEHLSARLCTECLAPVLAVIDPDAVTS